MKICCWNINWQHSHEKESDEDAELRIENNRNRAKVAETLLGNERPDVLALLEAGIDNALDIKGYSRCFLDRKYIYPEFHRDL